MRIWIAKIKSIRENTLNSEIIRKSEISTTFAVDGGGVSKRDAMRIVMRAAASYLLCSTSDLKLEKIFDTQIIPKKAACKKTQYEREGGAGY